MENRITPDTRETHVGLTDVYMPVAIYRSLTYEHSRALGPRNDALNRFVQIHYNSALFWTFVCCGVVRGLERELNC